MGKVKYIFREFLHANGMAPIADWKTRQTTYKAPWSDESYTEEGLRRTAEFAGFCDGYEGNPNRYKELITLETAVRNAASRLGFANEIKLIEDMKRKVPSEVNPESRYSRQHELGRTAKATNPYLEEIF